MKFEREDIKGDGEVWRVSNESGHDAHLGCALLFIHYPTTTSDNYTTAAYLDEKLSIPLGGSSHTNLLGALGHGLEVIGNAFNRLESYERAHDGLGGPIALMRFLLDLARQHAWFESTCPLAQSVMALVPEVAKRAGTDSSAQMLQSQTAIVLTELQENLISDARGFNGEQEVTTKTMLEEARQKMLRRVQRYEIETADNHAMAVV